MNFVACGLEESAGALRVRLDDDIALPVPENRTGRYRPYVGRAGLLLGLRPEHIMEQRPTLEPNQHPFEVVLDVTEPMGMDTLVHFQVSGTEVCGRVNPAAATRAGSRAKLVADLNHMHLIQDETGKVL